MCEFGQNVYIDILPEACRLPSRCFGHWNEEKEDEGESKCYSLDRRANAQTRRKEDNRKTKWISFSSIFFPHQATGEKATFSFFEKTRSQGNFVINATVKRKVEVVLSYHDGTTWPNWVKRCAPPHKFFTRGGGQRILLILI